jgi:hypothetical protein
MLYVITSSIDGRAAGRVEADSQAKALEAFADERNLSGRFQRDGAHRLAFFPSSPRYPNGTGLAYYANRP